MIKWVETCDQYVNNRIRTVLNVIGHYSISSQHRYFGKYSIGAVPEPCHAWTVLRKAPFQTSRDKCLIVRTHKCHNYHTCCLCREYSRFRCEINCETSKTVAVPNKTACLHESRAETTRAATLTMWHSPTQSLCVNEWRSSRTESVLEF